MGAAATTVTGAQAAMLVLGSRQIVYRPAGSSAGTTSRTAADEAVPVHAGYVTGVPSDGAGRQPTRSS